jgi:group I intron endonuclease
MYVVYKHVNRVNGKAYVGWTSTSIEERWNWHCDDALREIDNFVFHAAIRKHGIDVWDHLTLEITSTEQAAKDAEVRLIAEHKTFCYDHPESGYNMTHGGEGLSGFKHREESRAKTSQSLRGNRNGAGNKGRTWTTEQRAQISKTLTGRKRSETEVKKISASLKGNTRGRGNKGRSLSQDHVEKLRIAAQQREARKREQRENSH